LINLHQNGILNDGTKNAIMVNNLEHIRRQVEPSSILVEYHKAGILDTVLKEIAKNGDFLLDLKDKIALLRNAKILTPANLRTTFTQPLEEVQKQIEDNKLSRNTAALFTHTASSADDTAPKATSTIQTNKPA
jgi:hypothetical protein